MIEESGRIVAVSDETVWVETIRASACDTCKAQKGCGHGLINKTTSGQRFKLDVRRNGISAQVGDTAIIGIPESSLLRASIISYLMPILILILFAGAGKVFWGELASVMLGLLGLLVGFLLVREVGASESLAQGPVLLSVESLSVESITP